MVSHLLNRILIILPIEKTHIHFCKMCLGLNKRSPNVASRNELGRLSLKLQIMMNILKF